MRKPDSSVSVVTMLWAGRSASCGSIPDTGDIYLLPIDWIWSWAQQGCRGYFSRVKAAEVGSWPITFIQCRVKEHVELCLISSICFNAINAHNFTAVPTLHELDWLEKTATILDKTTYIFFSRKPHQILTQKWLTKWSVSLARSPTGESKWKMYNTDINDVIATVSFRKYIYSKHL